jgi:hypothetical protein
VWIERKNNKICDTISLRLLESLTGQRADCRGEKESEKKPQWHKETNISFQCNISRQYHDLLIQSQSPWLALW